MLHATCSLTRGLIAWDVADATVYMSQKKKKGYKKENNPLGHGSSSV